MVTWKNVIDRNMWVQVAPSPNAHAAGGNLCSDLRNDLTRNPFVYQFISSALLNRYNGVTKGWQIADSALGMAGTFGAGAQSVFAPSHALTGTVAAGCTTTSIILSTALPQAVGVNMLANRGGSGDYSYKIRITGNNAGGSGKTEEKWIVANTAGTTPTIILDSALSFTPGSGAQYEILSGRVFLLNAGTLASGSWKSFEVATNVRATKTQTNLPATIATDSALHALDELYVPYDRKPGEGFLVGAGTYDNASKNCLTATNSAAGTLTGQASAGDAAVLANEYRNFQVRIVEDTAIPTAVGQRRIIASHTAGASPVYTLGSNWTVTPSTTAKYVIELPNLIVCSTSGVATTYTYNYGPATVNNGTNSITADTWSTAYFAARGSAVGAGTEFLGGWAIQPDSAKNARHSFLYSIRGGGGVNIDMLDIAGGTTGAWSNAITYDGANQSFTTGTCGTYAPADNEGRFAYINFYTASAVNQQFRFDVKNRVMAVHVPTDWIQSGTAAVGKRIATLTAIDGSTKMSIILLQAHLAANCFELLNTY